MAGKRQHYIPRFLQEGFASHTEGSAVYTWVYRKGITPFNANIANVGVEGEFYTEGADTEVDDLITDAEGTWASLIRAMRSGKQADLADPQIPVLIAHLEVRTRHVRQNFDRAGNYLVSQFLNFMSDEAKFEAWLERQYRRNPSLLRAPIAKALKEAGRPASYLPLLLRQAERSFREYLRPILPALITQLRARLPQALRESAKSGHLRALRKAVSPEAGVRRYKKLVFSSVESPGASLILGDAPVLFRVQGSRSYKAFLDKGAPFDAVILPIAPERAIIGARESVTMLPRDLREAGARCSLEYFIAAENSGENVNLQKQIGEDAAIVSTTELEEIVARGLKE